MYLNVIKLNSYVCLVATKLDRVAYHIKREVAQEDNKKAKYLLICY